MVPKGSVVNSSYVIGFFLCTSFSSSLESDAELDPFEFSDLDFYSSAYSASLRSLNSFKTTDPS